MTDDFQSVYDRCDFTHLCKFRVFELPKPQGSKKIVGPYRMADATNIAGWRNAVIEAGAKEWGEQETCDDPIVAHIEFFLPKPKSASKRILFPAKKPDLDKLIRSTFDGITLAQIITDDSRIVHLTTSKNFVEPGQPVGASIILTKLTEKTNVA